MLPLVLPQIYTRVFYSWKSVTLEILGLKILAHLYLFSVAYFRAFSDAAHSRFFVRASQTMVTGLFKNASLALPKSLQVYFTCGSLSIWTVCGMG